LQLIFVQKAIALNLSGHNCDVLCEVFTPTRNTLDDSMHRSNEEHTNTRENTRIIRVGVSVAEKYTLDGANRFFSMKHKHKGHANE